MKRKPAKRRKPAAESEAVKVLREIAETICELRESFKNQKPPQIVVMPSPPAPVIIKLPPLDDGQTGAPVPWKPNPPPFQPQWQVTCNTAHTTTSGGTSTAVVWHNAAM